MSPRTRSYSRMTRRELLRTTGAGLLLAPFVPVFDAEAQQAPAKRLLFVYSSNGMVHEKWLPTFSGGNLTLSPILAPLERHKSKMLVVDGLAYNQPKWTGHNVGIVLTGSAARIVGENQLGTGVSVDQLIGEKISAGKKFRSIELGVQVDQYNDEHNALSYTSAAAPIRAENSPYKIFDRVFAGLMPTGKPAVDPAKLDQQSVIDFVKGDLARLQTRIGTAAKWKLDAHLQQIREIEQALTVGVGAASTDSCAVPSTGTKLNLFENDNVPALGRLQMKLATMALACDLTRVATVQYGRGGAQHRFSWLGPEFQSDPDNGPNDSTSGIHGLAHNEANPSSREKLARCHTWYAGEVATFVDLLKAVPEGNGSMADNTLVIWMNELGKGGNHTFDQTPWVLLGNLGGTLNTSKLISAPRASHNRLLLTLCHAFGLDNKTFGSAEFSTGGDLPGILA
jgi:Protein of unknown function (DUF1552)